MPDTTFDLTSAVLETNPFPHFSAVSVLSEKLKSDLFDWFQCTNKWKLVEMDFYEQYELRLLHAELPAHLQCLASEKTINQLKSKYIQEFKVSDLTLIDIVAHKLVNEQRIGIHNDYINGEETHRLVLHINPYWKDENGGLLILFNSSDITNMSKIVKPINNTVFGFEISRNSHHAVSKIYNFTRYTIVYTFKEI